MSMRVFLASFFIFVCFMHSTSEAKTRWNLPKGLSKNSESIKELSKILSCSRNFIEQARGGDEAVNVALIYIKRARELVNVNDEQLLSELRKACWVEFKEKQPVAGITREMMEKKLIELSSSYPSWAVSVVAKLINPNGSCQFVSFGFSVGLGFSLGLGLKAFRCESQDGRRFISLAPEVAGGFGIGASVTAGKGDLSMEKLTKDSPLAGLYQGRSSSNGLLVVIENGEGNAGVPYMLKEQSVGLGVGIFDMYRGFPLLRVIEQTDQFSYLINLLLSL